MNRGQPLVTESADELKMLLKQESNRQKRQRLHALYLFASGQVHSRQEAARVLGIHRETLGRWMQIYANGGLPALLDVYVAKGKKATLSEPVLADLERKLREPSGFASYQAMQLWLVETHQVQMNLSALAKFVRRRFGARPKVVRPSHIKKL